MGQFSRYVESGDPPPLLRRGFLIIAPCAAVVNAIFARQLDETLIAVLLIAIWLPAGIAPKRHRAVVEALDRRPVVGVAVFCVLGIAWFFVVLSQFLGRLTSLYIGVPAALAVTGCAAWVRFRRLRSARAVRS
ncbi:hypothetical protein ACFV9C_03870 [Kribbella sp. NPDC059898]|uniref:hypothetical protein n=1 Tax=Kribbella sp. NPDC059898 TaxID=3346995 RepID=UPI00364914CD